MHKNMAVDIDEIIEFTHLKNKITAIIPTGPAPMKALLWSVFSLLLRSTPNDILEHFIVCINGPDKRTGNPALQDQKQNFLEDLRRMKWYTKHAQDKKDMPITVIRAWSRVGHAEAVEMGVTWVHTDNYLLMHDDTIIMSKDWQEEVKNNFFTNKNAMLAYGSPDLHFAHCDHAIAHGLFMLRLPNLNTSFLLVKKSLMLKSQAHWHGYNLGSYQNPIQFDINDEVVDLENFLQYYKSKGLLRNPPQTSELYNFFNAGMGAWAYYKSCQNNYDIVKLDPDIAEHLNGASMVHINRFKEILETKQEIYEPLEKEILEHPDYGPLYEKYKEFA